MSYGTKDWQDWVLNEDEALPLIEHAYKSGINTWDTVPPSSPPHLYLQWFITM
jgi:aryl-alcohol dehydrogenase-like predicted oxidoreductase